MKIVQNRTSVQIKRFLKTHGQQPQVSTSKACHIYIHRGTFAVAQPGFHFGGGGSELWERAPRYYGPPVSP